MKNEENLKNYNAEISSEGFLDTPETVFEQISKYGTYEIQPTADRADFFPAIAQGLPTQPTNRNKQKDKTKSKLKNSKTAWDKSNLN